MNGLPQLENLSWFMCRFEPTMFRSETPVPINCAIQKQKKNGRISGSFHCESLDASRAFSIFRQIMSSSEPSVLYFGQD